MSALDAVLAYEQGQLRLVPSLLLSSEVWLHQVDGAALFAEVARRGLPIKNASLMSDPAPCLELASGLRVFSRIMSARVRKRLAASILASGATRYAHYIDRSYRIYGRRQPRAGWMHTSRVAITIRCTVHDDCRAAPALGYACLADHTKGPAR